LPYTTLFRSATHESGGSMHSRVWTRGATAVPGGGRRLHRAAAGRPRDVRNVRPSPACPRRVPGVSGRAAAPTTGPPPPGQGRRGSSAPRTARRSGARTLPRRRPVGGRLLRDGAVDRCEVRPPGTGDLVIGTVGGGRSHGARVLHGLLERLGGWLGATRGGLLGAVGGRVTGSRVVGGGVVGDRAVGGGVLSSGPVRRSPVGSGGFRRAVGVGRRRGLLRLEAAAVGDDDVGEHLAQQHHLVTCLRGARDGLP